jgi:hypothetical protein
MAIGKVLVLPGPNFLAIRTFGTNYSVIGIFGTNFPAFGIFLGFYSFARVNAQIQK